MGAGDSTIAGGLGNVIETNAFESVISGGSDNFVRFQANNSVIGGGYFNIIEAEAQWATIAGGNSGRIEHNAPGAFIGGGSSHAIRSYSSYSTVSGGYNHTIETNSGASTISGGSGNRILASSPESAIAGGRENVIQDSAWRATISGGYQNNIGRGASDATIGGGKLNSVAESASAATIAGGNGNGIGLGSSFSTISGGQDNHVSDFATYATIPGGFGNRAGGQCSLAAGQYANAAHNGSFVWADGAGSQFSSTGPNQFIIRASGGVGIGTTSPQSSLHIDKPSGEAAIRLTSGGISWPLILHMTATSDFLITNGGAARLIIKPGGQVGIGRNPTTYKLEVEGDASKTTAGSWQANSDRRIKRDIAPVRNALETLAKVRLVSFRYTDDYRAEHPTIENRPYLNVVAQEFAEVFPEAVRQSGDRLPDGAPILSVDTYPLTIYSAAAVQELNQKLEQKETEITELKRRLERLEQLITAKN